MPRDATAAGAQRHGMADTLGQHGSFFTTEMEVLGHVLAGVKQDES